MMDNNIKWALYLFWLSMPSGSERLEVFLQKFKSQQIFSTLHNLVCIPQCENWKQFDILGY